MQKLFNKILVPIDFSRRSKKLIEKAVGLATDYNCSITLLHVAAIPPYAAVAMAEGNLVLPYDPIEDEKELVHELIQMAERVMIRMGKHCEVNAAVIMGSWNEGIINYVMQHGHDLVLIGQKERIAGKREMFLNPDKIAIGTNVPVITVPPNRRVIKLSSIVIPVTDFLPVRKLIYGIYMATPNHATLNLLAVQNHKNKEACKHYLQRAFQLIKENCSVRTVIDMVDGENTATAVNRYAAARHADLMIVNPGTQTKMPGFFAKLMGRFVQKYTALPVMTVTPLSL